MIHALDMNLITIDPKLSANENLYNLCKLSKPDINWDDSHIDDYVFILMPSDTMVELYKTRPYIKDYRERLIDCDRDNIDNYLHPSKLRVEKLTHIPSGMGEEYDKAFPDTEFVVEMDYYRPIFTNVVWKYLHSKYLSNESNRSDKAGYDLNTPFLSLPKYNNVDENKITLDLNNDSHDLILRTRYEMSDDSNLIAEDELVKQFSNEEISLKTFYQKMFKLYGHPESKDVIDPFKGRDLMVYVDSRLFVPSIDVSKDDNRELVIKEYLQVLEKDYTF